MKARWPRFSWALETAASFAAPEASFLELIQAPSSSSLSHIAPFAGPKLGPPTFEPLPPLLVSQLGVAKRLPQATKAVKASLRFEAKNTCHARL